MRLLGGLGLAWPSVALATLFAAMSGAVNAWVGADVGVDRCCRRHRGDRRLADRDAHVRPRRASVAPARPGGGAIGRGSLSVTVAAPVQRSRPRGPARTGDRTAISATLAETTDAATIDKLTGVGEPPGPARGAVHRGRAGQPLRPAAVGRVRRHRPLQGGQRHLRPRRRRRRAPRRRPGDQGEPPGDRHDRPVRRRGVHAPPDRDRRRGGRGPDREAAHRSSRSERFAVEGSPDVSVTISIGIAGGVGCTPPSDDARPRRRRRDVLGQVARSEPDLHLRRARRGRPRAACTDLGRRPSASPWRSAGAPATPRRPRSRRSSPRCPTTAASRRRSSPRSSSRWPASSTCRPPRSTGSGSRRCSTTSARSRVPQEILDKPSALTSAEWRTVVQHPRIGQVILEQAAALKEAVPIILHHHERFSGPRLSRSGCAATTSRSGPGSWRSPMPTTR